MTFDILSDDGKIFNNLTRARDIVKAINELKQIQVALKAAFAHRELDGGPTAAIHHPLYHQTQARILQLEESLVQLV